MTTTRPTGRAAVVDALVDAAARLIVDQGTHVSVRQIATEAGVNHGLVHLYFGSKRQLLAAGFDLINERASREIDDHGFPPADLAARRGGELGRALARMHLDDLGNQFTTHPITTSWKQALANQEPELDGQSVNAMIACAATLALGWAVFADQVCSALGVEPEQRTALDHQVTATIRELGGLPDHTTSKTTQTGDSDRSS